MARCNNRRGQVGNYDYEGYRNRLREIERISLREQLTSDCPQPYCNGLARRGDLFCRSSERWECNDCTLPFCPIRISGAMSSYAELTSRRPAGAVCEAYVINGALYVWNRRNGEWEFTGVITPPERYTMPCMQAEPFSGCGAPVQGPCMPPTLSGIDIGDFECDCQCGRMCNGEFLAFSSGDAVKVKTTPCGNSANLCILNYPMLNHLCKINNDGTVVLGINEQLVTSVPRDCVVQNVQMTVGSAEALDIPQSAAVRPCVQLYRAPVGSNRFVPIEKTLTMPCSPLCGRRASGSMRGGGRTCIGAPLKAGDRLLIAGRMEIEGTGDCSAEIALCFSGGISLR